jgi:hypothetical protein
MPAAFPAAITSATLSSEGKLRMNALFDCFLGIFFEAMAGDLSTDASVRATGSLRTGKLVLHATVSENEAVTGAEVIVDER